MEARSVDVVLPERPVDTVDLSAVPGRVVGVAFVAANRVAVGLDDGLVLIFEAIDE